MAATFFELVTCSAAWSYSFFVALSFSINDYALDISFGLLKHVYIKQIYKWAYIWLDLLRRLKVTSALYKLTSRLPVSSHTSNKTSEKSAPLVPSGNIMSPFILMMLNVKQDAVNAIQFIRKRSPDRKNY